MSTRHPDTRTKPRFDAIQAPDDSWTVFDVDAGEPAESDGLVLVGLDRRTALLVARSLNGEERHERR